MACIRAVEEVNVKKVVKCCRKYPELRGLINPEDPNIRSSASFAALKDHAVQLARADVQDDVEDLLHSDHDDDQAYHQKKEHILQKLRRLCPGESKSLNAVRTQSGCITTDPSDMAQALVSHWSQVFAAKDSNQTLLRQWLDRLFGGCREGRYNTGLPDARAPGWQVRREHVKSSITYARSTMPGPDSIPAALWKAIGDLGVDVLHRALQELLTDDARSKLQQAYSRFQGGEGNRPHDFNLSLLCCLPKKASGIDAIHGTFYDADSTRPLSIVNVDNRILASACRLAWEPLLGAGISRFQRGFINGR